MRCIAHAVRAEVRPVDGDTVAERAAQERMHWNAERFALHIEQRVDDRADGVLVDAAAGLDGASAEKRRDLLDAQGILADHELAQRFDDARHTRRAEMLTVLGPPDDTRVGAEL